MVGLSLIALAGMQAQMSPPILWLKPSGEIEVAGRPVEAKFTPGASRVKIPGGFGFDFNGTHGGILLPDLVPLRLTGSMTISVWLDLRGYASSGATAPGAQVLFRGDDRGGLDPYSLTVHSDGTIFFGIDDSDNKTAAVSGPISLNKWTHVIASFDAIHGQLMLWVGNELVATSNTKIVPLGELDRKSAPGIGIGNVQNDHGPHNQPLNGIVADLRLYDTPVEPDMIDEEAPPWVNIPPR